MTHKRESVGHVGSNVKATIGCFVSQTSRLGSAGRSALGAQLVSLLSYGWDVCLVDVHGPFLLWRDEGGGGRVECVADGAIGGSIVEMHARGMCNYEACIEAFIHRTNRRTKGAVLARGDDGMVASLRCLVVYIYDG